LKLCLERQWSLKRKNYKESRIELGRRDEGLNFMLSERLHEQSKSRKGLGSLVTTIKLKLWLEKEWNLERKSYMESMIELGLKVVTSKSSMWYPTKETLESGIKLWKSDPMHPSLIVLCWKLGNCIWKRGDKCIEILSLLVLLYILIKEQCVIVNVWMLCLTWIEWK
jgi:hypothetical protein